MFVRSVLAYPAALALLCLGVGLLVDRAGGSFLPAALLPAIGLAGLIAISQLCTYTSALAPATPYVMLAAALAGFALARARLTGLARRVRERPLGPLLPLLAYALALAPVLLAGRPSFSSYLVLGDSAVHMVGADYLVRHGQDFAHLDARNSYGLTLDAYYNSSYPSGADTVLGGSARLLGLPVIWAFQPFNAFVLALASGPAWLLARRCGLGALGGAIAALAATVSALIYGYELIGSIKELTALAMILSLGALTVMHRRWLLGPANRALAPALVLAGGTSALGVGFGAWGGVTAALLLTILFGALRAGRAHPRQALALCVTAAAVTVVAALPTFLDLGGSLNVATTIASTSNPGNLHTPLRWDQVFGIWLNDSYKQSPTGVASAFTDALVALALAACVLGVLGMLRARTYALLAWLLAMVALLAVVSLYATTWVEAKGLALTSPIVVLVAWTGVGALRGLRARARAPLLAGAAALALALVAGVLASDAAQYHAANLAPSSRYDELASLDRRFARRGPALFTDFDEYALYVLRDLDVGGPSFTSPPPALAALASGRGQPVELDRAPPAALRAYPLIITRRDPAATPPPAAYREVWQGTYYEVWEREAGAPAALAHLTRSLSGPAYCAQVRTLARAALGRRATLIAASRPDVVTVSVRDLPHDPRWRRTSHGLLVGRGGSLSIPFSVEAAGEWDVYLAGEFSPALEVRVDGRALATVEGQLGGNTLVPDLTAPLRVALAAGRHLLSLTRGENALAPGDGGAAVLDRVYAVPARAPARTLVTLDARASAGALCAPAYAWVEELPRGPA